ncbi:MAG: DUF350 domain-containing protein [Zavarzinia sp.]|nr:DUF350 domain-containing protein [Zavarzinia sp.]
MDILELIQLKYVVGAIVYSAIGIAIFAAGFVLLDLLTPRVGVWRELVEKQNVAMGIFLGAIALGIAIIVAASIHG